ncbi:MAG TPA: response regulator [Candidatus Ozemobacteraceae bacterium]|nr:response regulator [Candidatus Ozemobacteraceae bacterium]
MKQKTILLVEDNPNDIDLTRRAFEKCRIYNDLVVKEDGREALDYLFGPDGQSGAANDVLPMLVMLDLKLPRIDGLEVLRKIRQDMRTHRMPVVILTSSKEEEDVAASYDLGANSYIRKPVDFQQFAQAVQNLGLYWLVLNEPPPKVKK